MNEWLIDTHCHLDLIKDIPLRINDEANLPIKTVAVTNTPAFYQHNIANFNDMHNIRIALGYHPEIIAIYPNEIEKFMQLLPTTKYIGEIGLDGSKQYEQGFSLQVEVFTAIINAVAETGSKILTVHSRNAVKQVIRVIREAQAHKNNKFILHWYTGDISSLKTAIDIGCYFSINHKMVSTQKGIEIIKQLPLERMLTETDAPFTLGQNENRLSSLNQSITGIANIRQMDKKTIQSTIYNNFKDILNSFPEK